MTFKHYENGLPYDFVCYADFECMLQNVDSCANVNEKTVTTQIHVPIAYCYKVVCLEDNTLTKPTEYYCGENVVEHFLNAMMEEADFVREN